MASTASEKYVFISDIHLGNENSFKPGQCDRYPYGWINENTDVLQKFLDQFDSNRETQGAGGLVIVGDLLDTWVCPLQLNPPTFDDVLSADHNKGVVQALNRIADKKNLWYVQGNHDMLIQQEPTTLQKYITNIKFLDPYKDGPKYFYGGRLVAEHGHQYCLFNAVDTWTRPNDHLPLGFFLARLSAQGMFEKNKGPNFLDFLKQKIYGLLNQKLLHHANVHLGELVLDMFKNYEQRIGARYTPFEMHSVDGFGADIEYDVVRSIFSKIYEEWNEKSGSGILAPIAALGDTAFGLRLAADKKYLIAGRFGLGRVRIALFGHTHEYEIKKGLCLSRQPSSATAPKLPPNQARVIYGNCGTWIDTKPCTFIVTERVTVDGESRIYVRGYKYNKSGAVLRKRNNPYIVV